MPRKITWLQRRLKPKKWRNRDCGVQPSNLELDCPGGTGLQLSWIWSGDADINLLIEESQDPYTTWLEVAVVNAAAAGHGWTSSFGAGVFVKARAHRFSSPAHCAVESDVQQLEP